MNKKDKIAVYLTMLCCIREVASCTRRRRRKRREKKEKRKKEQKMKNEKEQVQCK